VVETAARLQNDIQAAEQYLQQITDKLNALRQLRRDLQMAEQEAASYLTAEERQQQAEIEAIQRRWNLNNELKNLRRSGVMSHTAQAPIVVRVNKTGERIPFNTEEAAGRWINQYRTSGLGGEFTMVYADGGGNYAGWWNQILSERDEAERKPAQTFVAKVWRALAAHDEAFLYGKTTSRKADDIAKVVTIPGKLVTMTTGGGSVRVMGSNGYLTIHDADTDLPYIRATEAESKGKKGGGGTQLYQAALDWIHNNGKRIKDDSGLTAINAIRRTSNFLSSALRWGTTKHLKPHADQKVPWGKSDR